MSKVQAQTVKKIHAHVKKCGLLMLADAELPSVVGLITGESVKGSWWGHPLGNLIFNSSSDVEDSDEVLTLKSSNAISGARPKYLSLGEMDS